MIRKIPTLLNIQPNRTDLEQLLPDRAPADGALPPPVKLNELAFPLDERDKVQLDVFLEVRHSRLRVGRRGGRVRRGEVLVGREQCGPLGWGERSRGGEKSLERAGA